MSGIPQAVYCNSPSRDSNHLNNNANNNGNKNKNNDINNNSSNSNDNNNDSDSENNNPNSLKRNNVWICYRKILAICSGSDLSFVKGFNSA